MLYEPKLHIVLYAPEIPYNAGSVGRTCVAVGAKLWLVRPLGFQVDDYHLRRAGMDYWRQLEWEVVDDWSALEASLPTGRRWCFSKKATRSYLDVDYEPNDVIVFGNESSGLPDSLLSEPDRCLRVPMRTAVRCLNLSNTVAIAAYEAMRQWSQRADGGNVNLSHDAGYNKSAAPPIPHHSVDDDAAAS